MNTPKVIFEDKHILVLDKPYGWVVNEAISAKGPVIQTWLKENFSYETSQSNLYRGGIVHRLDKPTSGILVVAKTKKAFNNLQKQFKERTIDKEYIALVHGIVEPKEGIVDVPTGRLPWRRDRFGALPGGRATETRYKVKNTYARDRDLNLSLLSVFPKTGRTHQIRIHMKHIGHSIVSDPFYAGRKTLRLDLKWCPRLFLHAAKISLTHPISGKRLYFESKLSDDLKTALDNLKHNF